MSAIRKITFSLALAAGSLAGGNLAHGAELRVEPVCGQSAPASCYAPATAYRPVTVMQPVTVYRPEPCCERVGPIRRFFRRVFRPCCPPPVVAARVSVAVPVAPPCPAPCPPAAPAWTPPSAPITIDRPVPAPGAFPPSPPPPMEAPATGSSLRRPEVQPPPAPPTPVRFERIASLKGADGVVRAQANAARQVVLVQSGQPATRRQVEADAQGKISVELTPGTWVVYAASAAGALEEKGRLVIREKAIINVRVFES